MATYVEKDIVDFSKPPSMYWDDSVKISYLQRRIIVYSIMYYEHDESCVPDYVYDGISHQLVRLQQQASLEEWKRSRYYYAMHDFDGSTGFDIPSRLTPEDREWLTKIANLVHDHWKGRPLRGTRPKEKSKT